VASRNRRNITGSGTPEKSHSAYPCEVAGGSSLVEPWDNSLSMDALGFPTAGTWRTGRVLRTAASVLAEATYAVMAPRRPMGKRGLKPSAPPSEWLPSRRWSRRAARRRAQPVGAPFALVESTDLSVDGFEALRRPQHTC
jgi:hypothetical protein